LAGRAVALDSGHHDQSSRSDPHRVPFTEVDSQQRDVVGLWWQRFALTTGLRGRPEAFRRHTTYTYPDRQQEMRTRKVETHQFLNLFDFESLCDGRSQSSRKFVSAR